jgi:cytidylate kinase
MAKRVIAISRTNGAGGEVVGRLVADTLGFRYVDEEIITRAAEKAGLEPSAVADIEQRRGLVARIVEGLSRAGGPGGGVGWYIVPSSSEFARTDEFRTLILEAIHETAAAGNVVIVAHAASMPLAGMEGLLRVLITAPTETRARRAAEESGVGLAEANKAVKASDAARADYFRRFYSIDQELPTHYDLVLNTDRLDTAQAASIVARAARD